MKKIFALMALAALVSSASAQTQEPKKEVSKKEACCKKMDEKKVGTKMACDKDSKMACCQKKAAEAKKPLLKKS